MKSQNNNDSYFLTEEEIENLLQDMREAEAGMTEIIRNDPNLPKIKELLIEAEKYPENSSERKEIFREIFRLQKEDHGIL